MNTVANISEGLLLSMSQMLSLIRMLIDSACRKETLIAEDDVGGLEDLLMEEAETSYALKQQEKELRHKADNLRHALGIPNKTAQLKEIFTSISDEDCRDCLSELRDEMAQAIDQLNHQNAKLKELLRYRIGYTDFMLNLLHSPQNRLRSYNVQGIREEGFSDYCHREYHA